MEIIGIPAMRRITIRARLAHGFAGVIVMLLTVSAIGVWRITTIMKDLHQLMT